MAAVGQMFYTHGMDWQWAGGRRVPPLTLGEALKAGGLDWEIGAVNVISPDSSATSMAPRKAIVRLDCPPEDSRRVLGIVPQHFAPIQNREAGAALDAVFGNGKSVYHTGGYLGNGETVWLLAKIGKTLRVGRDDIVLPYALMVNGHDGRHALTIRLTSVRVVCENTLAMAMRTSVGPLFRRDHREASLSCAEAAHQFFAGTMRDLDMWQESFVELSRRTCSDAAFRDIVQLLFPDPKQPRTAMTNPRVFATWERRLLAMRAARRKIEQLRESGKGMSLPASRGTFWGALNAVTEYVDHHRPVKGSRFVYAVLGRGMDLKIRAFELMQMAAHGVASTSQPTPENRGRLSRLTAMFVGRRGKKTATSPPNVDLIAARDHFGPSQQRSAQDHKADGKVNHQTSHIDERGYEGSGGCGGIETESAKNERQN